MVNDKTLLLTIIIVENEKVACNVLCMQTVKLTSITRYARLVYSEEINVIMQS